MHQFPGLKLSRGGKGQAGEPKHLATDRPTRGRGYTVPRSRSKDSNAAQRKDRDTSTAYLHFVGELADLRDRSRDHVCAVSLRFILTHENIPRRFDNKSTPPPPSKTTATSSPPLTNTTSGHVLPSGECPRSLIYYLLYNVYTFHSLSTLCMHWHWILSGLVGFDLSCILVVYYDLLYC